MPTNGLLFSGELRYSLVSELTSSYSGDGNGVFGHSAAAVTEYTEDVLTKTEAMFLSLSSAPSGWEIEYQGPGGVFSDSDSTPLDFLSLVIVFTGVKVYSRNLGALMRFEAGAVEVWVNGSLATTLSGFSADSNSNGPAYFPFIAHPMEVTWACSAGSDLAIFPDTWEYDSVADSEVSGGWEIKPDGGVWEWLPVLLHPISLPAVGGAPFGLDVDGIAVSDRTAGDIGVAHSRIQAGVVEEGTENPTGVVVTVTCSEGVIHQETVAPGSNCNMIGGGTGMAARKVFKTFSTQDGNGGTVRLIPNLWKGVRRMAGGYRSFWRRYGMPKTEYAGSRMWTDGGVSDTVTEIEETHPSQSKIRAVVGDATHAMEDTFSYPSYAPIAVQRFRIHSESYTFENLHSSCPCPPPTFSMPGGLACADPVEMPAISCEFVWPEHENLSQSETVSFHFPHSVEDSASNNDMDGYLDHADPDIRYFNYWVHPLWHYGRHWPDPEDEEGTQEEWKVDGGAISRKYFMEIREQFHDAPYLDPSEQLKTRNFLINGVGEEFGHTPFYDAFVFGIRPIGISRWQTQDVNRPASKTLDDESEPLWSAEDASLSFGTDITVNPAASICVVELEVGSFEHPPYLYPHICDRVTIGWSLTNIESVKVYAVGIDGQKALLKVNPSDTETTEGQTYRIPIDAQNKFAGSWAIDNGDGYVIDEGADALASGISAATMSDDERMVAFSLLRGRTMAKLRFEIEVTDANVDVTLEYPTWVHNTEHPLAIQENAQIVNLLWEDGPGVRIGNHVWSNGFNSILDAPRLSIGLGYKMSVVDWLCVRRVLFQGDSSIGGTPDLSTELTQLFDSFEGQGIAVSDGEGFAFILPRSTEPTDHTMRAAIVNTYAEIPPLAIFPRKARDPEDWSESGDYSNEVWDWAQEKRYLVNAHDEAHLFVEDDQWTVPYTGDDAVSGWAITEHAHELTNSETDGRIRSGGREFAHSLRPWHGWFMVLHTEFGAAGVIALASRRDGAIFRAHDSESLKLAMADPASPKSFDPVRDTGLTAVDVSLTAPPDALWVGRIGEDGTVDLRSTSDLGNTWTNVIALPSSDALTICHATESRIYVFTAEAGTLVGRLFDPLGNLVHGPWDTNVTGLTEDVRLTSTAFPRKDESFGIDIGISDDGSEYVLTSTDLGLTFS